MKSPDQENTQNGKRISNTPWARLSLRTKTLTIFLSVALLPLIGLAIYNTLQTQSALTNAAEISLSANAKQTAASLETFIKSTLDNIRVEARSIDLVDYLILLPSQRPGSKEETRALAFLRNLDRKDPINILSYGVIDRRGKNILDTVSANIGAVETNNNYYKQALETGLPFAGVAYQEDGERVLYFASPVRNALGEIIGVLRVKYSAGILQQITNANALAAGANTTVILLDEYHIRLAETTDINLLQKSIVPLSADLFKTAVSEGRLLDGVSATEQATNNQEFEVALNNAAKNPFIDVDLYADELYEDRPGIDSVAMAGMENQGWIVAVSQPRSLLLQDVQRQTIVSLVILIVTALFVAVIAVSTSRNLTSPLVALTKTAESIASGDLESRASIQTQDEIGVLAVTFNTMADQLNNTLLGLEQRVEERTRALASRSEQLEAIADVARSVATTQELDQLLSLITILVSERFNFYHVGIFLIDENRQYANLRAANSEGGRVMLARAHRLKIGEQGIVGYVAFRGQPRVALDVGEEAVFFTNPDLPDTHSEVALPLKYDQQIIGVLDIQSKDTNAFSQEAVNIFSILADQVTVAIQNTKSLEQAQRALHVAEIASGQLTGDAWKGYTQTLQNKGYRYDGVKSEALKEASVSRNEDDALYVPVQLRGQTIGRLKLKAPAANRKWTEDERAIIESTAERVAIAMEGARLLDQAQKRAARESFLSDVGAKLGTSFQLDSILRDTVEELGQNLQGSTVSFQLINPSAPPTADSPKADGASARRKKAE